MAEIATTTSISNNNRVITYSWTSVTNSDTCAKLTGLLRQPVFMSLHVRGTWDSASASLLASDITGIDGVTVTDINSNTVLTADGRLTFADFAEELEVAVT